VLPLPWLAGGLALALCARLLVGRRNRGLIRLRDGRRVRLVSSVALLDGSAADLLALEYLSELRGGSRTEQRLEARSLVQIVGARGSYAGCRRAVVTTLPGEQVFTFRRPDSGPDWYETEGLD
jgi:hypothetical protein